MKGLAWVSRLESPADRLHVLEQRIHVLQPVGRQDFSGTPHESSASHDAALRDDDMFAVHEFATIVGAC